ncbi:MAG: serine hydrolase [Alphaproteobacteria bacterium]|nr:MAG: serine hydrolase [Alphaproteobacteria bacterium]
MRLVELSVVVAALCAAPVTAAALAPPQASESPVAALAPNARRAIDDYVEREMRRQRIPGVAIGVYSHGRPLYLKGYGFADLEWGAPVGPDTVMQTGSLAKQFVATAILKLAEDGKLKLDDPVSLYFPEAPPGWAGVRLEHLLSHTSGIGAYDSPELTGPGGAFDYRRDFTEDALAAAIAALPVAFKAGEDWSYNNANYVLLGIMIHRITGQFYGDYLQESFFKPLGMTHTRVISDTDIIPKRASGYEIQGGALRNQAWVSPTFNATADGTIYTTIEDMGCWERALDTGSLLSPSSMQRLWTPVLLADGKPNAQGYGLGWRINTFKGHRRISHNGAWQGFTSTMVRFPDDGLTLVVFANLDSGNARPDLIARVVAGLVDGDLMPAPTPVLEDDPERALRLRRFLEKAARGDDLTDDFAVGAGYTPDSALGRDVAAALPEGWTAAPMLLVSKIERPDGSGRYSYRIGPDDDSRLLTAALAPSGRIAGFGVAPDPDNR